MTHESLTADSLKAFPLPVPHEGSKDERGSALVLGGSRSVPGAALLAGIAALRAGAGKLKIATVESRAAGMGLAVPEAMVIDLPETPEGGVDGARASDSLQKMTKGCDALLIGPGLTEDGPTTKLAVELLEALPDASFILDAAAVSGLAAHAAGVRRHGERLVITPHAGEMAQLLDRSRDAVEADPLDAALKAADLLHAVVVMKGAKTWIVDPRGARWLYEGGGVGLATSGSGDVLAGIAVGLLARGLAPLPAALWAVFLHGEAGKRLAASLGPVGFLARELSGEVPGLLRETGG
ncbi:yjeF C-terminal region, hydroxyethylthiazole kinase-related [Methylobacterium sp. UNC378MF]|uniref:NAD(P)H-hydrate dehydratase n=1 Tax=Methylobacterium sp. UNC378MF TaxID=1502748 RepID=UPI00087FDC2F|nr:NAD(P)H-hydrate dehydratase [Methylobacterium sp. UNC378MF]SDA29141.1 yjeF C-terminal region, hydroxyethylthiazole kinase-related [Methylobacterium sp. UNC378MF]